MDTRFSWRGWLVPAMTALMLGFLQPAAAQQPAAPGAAPVTSRIDGFDVEPISQAGAGRELLFTLYGSPGGVARVQISGATGALLMEELEPGLYEGIYTIRARDKITAASQTTVNLRQGNQVATAVLDEPLIGTPRASRALPTSTRVRVDRFAIEQPQSLSAGNELRFTLTGTPDAVASVRLAGVRGKVDLNEVRRGVYQGAYVIKQRDRVVSSTAITPYLRQGTQQTALAGQTLGVAVSQQAAVRPVAPPPPPAVCNLCGVVEAVNPVQVQGEGSLVGKIGGGVAGAVIGSQIGKGDGRKLAQIAGVVGGAVAGNEIEKRMRAATHYEVVVRLDNGGSQTVQFATQPEVRIGTRVRVEENGATLRLI